MIRSIPLNLKIDTPILDNINNVTGTVVYEPLEQWDKLDQVHILWAHDVLPTIEGLSSAVKIKHGDPAVAGTYDPQYSYNVKKVYCADGTMLHHFRAEGYDIKISASGLATVRAASSTVQVSYAFRGNEGTIFFSSDKLAEYMSNSTTFASLTPTGITPANETGICNALNYMIAYEPKQVNYSQPGNYGEFRETVAGVDTGAGFERILELTGVIVCVYQITNGAIVYGTDNIISMTYSQNFDIPWNFRQLEGSGGVSRYEDVAYDSTSGMHFAKTKKGIVQVNNSEIKPVFPELNDFLAGSIFFDSDGAGTFTKRESYTTAAGVNTPRPLRVKVNLIDNRFLTISYGLLNAVFKYCLIFDSVLKQWGKIKVDHLTTFSMENYNYQPAAGATDQIPTPNNIAFLKSNGGVDYYRTFYQDQIASQAGTTTSNGEILIGDIRFTSNKITNINKLKIFGLVDLTNFHIYVKTRLPNGTWRSEVEFTHYLAGTNDSIEFLGFCSGASHRIRIIGSFSIKKVEVVLSQGAKYA